MIRLIPNSFVFSTVSFYVKHSEKVFKLSLLKITSCIFLSIKLKGRYEQNGGLPL